MPLSLRLGQRKDRKKFRYHVDGWNLAVVLMRLTHERITICFKAVPQEAREFRPKAKIAVCVDEQHR